MKYHKLGESDLHVSEICLGTMTWGEQNTEGQAHEQIDYALSRGVNFVDVAEMYPVPPRAETQGRTEAFVGTWGRWLSCSQTLMKKGRSRFAWMNFAAFSGVACRSADSVSAPPLKTANSSNP